MPTTHRLHHGPGVSPLVAWLVSGFVAGALAVLIFHQGALAVLHALGVTPAAPYSMKATAPFGVPAVWSYAFWGGVWGVIGAALFRRMEPGPLILTMLVFGAIAPTLVAWFVVAPLKGAPVAAGFHAAGMATGLIVNAMWGLGTGLGLALFGHRAALRR